MLISVLIPAYARPEQLGEALASIAQQDRSLIGEIIIADDSPRAYWDRNQAVIAASGLTDLIDYVPSEPSRGTYPNQWFLGTRAKCDHLLFLHNDDMLCPAALRTLADACMSETDTLVKLWFGRNLIMDEEGRVDPARSADNDRVYGKTGGARAQPMWQWCLTQSVPPDAFLIARDTYLQHMQGPRDGNVGDWAMMVRLANSGVWARFIDQEVSMYRVQADSVTNAGRGMDVHLYYEFTRQLRVPPEGTALKQVRASRIAPVATIRYARDGERLHAWKCYVSRDWTWRQRLSRSGVMALMALSMPRALWTWALRNRD
ncbi:glycosyltransferase family 2 protein [Variovorax sp. dw_308]|uniref:glycosyltransferase family 2 protein n=1 Tax=Variovorax sp. dw_308 TaxID=2721546 RepID=UPI001C47C80A|nr:glycosyltransferase [Variovorax sp. dw_308]